MIHESWVVPFQNEWDGPKVILTPQLCLLWRWPESIFLNRLRISGLLRIHDAFRR